MFIQKYSRKLHNVFCIGVVRCQNPQNTNEIRLLKQYQYKYFIWLPSITTNRSSQCFICVFVFDCVVVQVYGINNLSVKGVVATNTHTHTCTLSAFCWSQFNVDRFLCLPYAHHSVEAHKWFVLKMYSNVARCLPPCWYIAFSSVDLNISLAAVWASVYARVLQSKQTKNA